MGARQETIDRYRHLRTITNRHLSGALKHLSKTAIKEAARRIGLPLDKVKTGVRACLAGEKNPEGIVVKAVNRRGRKILCRVTCKTFAINRLDEVVRGA